MLIDEWPFQDPPNTAVVTTVQAVEQERILFVMHGNKAGDWQFHNGEPAKLEDSIIVSLQDIAELDPSIKQLATLPPGWFAMRKHPENDWRCYKSDSLSKIGVDSFQIHCVND